jgi:hypothetical protein
MLTSDIGQGVTWLPVPAGHYAADPFGIERGGTLHVLYEDYDHRRALGTIHHVAMAESGAISEPKAVFEPGVHASYPFLIEHEDAIFMLPELSASGDLVLYEATDFPQGWRPAATLLAGVPAVDASVVEFAGRWWMFACRIDHGVNHDLFVWHASNLFGPWTAHAQTPVRTDGRSARPGGTPFVSNGTLYRPSQDSSRTYGGRLVINRVDVLTPFAFAEEPLTVVEPRLSRPDGLHTLSAAGRRTLIDGNRRRFVPEAFRSRVTR